MDAQQFLAEFGHIANAPGGVGRLRTFVLQLAVQGRLFNRQDPCRHYVLGELGQWGSGGTPAKTHADYYGGDIPWLVIGDLNDGVVTSASASITQKGLANSAAKLIPPGALLIGMYGSIGKLGITDMPCATNQAIAHCIVNERLAHTRYLFIFVRANRETLFAQGKGLAQQNISQTILKAQKIDLPSVEEQSRIVAKVDELMALCDQLEEQQQARRKLQNALRQSTLQALASAQSPHELQDGWKRLEANFGRLFGEQKEIEELRTTILELAIKGLLTEQLPTDSNAVDILKARPKTATLHSCRSRTTINRSPEILDSELPFSCPVNWEWVRLSNIGDFLGGGTPSKTNPVYWKGSIPWVSPKDMKKPRISSSQDSISEKAVKETSVKLIPPNSLLFVVRGMILAHSFPVGLTTMEVTINQDMKALCPHRVEIAEFLLLLLQGSKRRFLEMVERSTHGTCRLEFDRLSRAVVGIPPLTEQKRIVDRVSQLMQLCDRLEVSLREANQLAEKLATSAVAALNGITIEQEKEPPVKVPNRIVTEGRSSDPI